MDITKAIVAIDRVNKRKKGKEKKNNQGTGKWLSMVIPTD
jgi:hypothetical protein